MLKGKWPDPWAAWPASHAYCQPALLLITCDTARLPALISFRSYVPAARCWGGEGTGSPGRGRGDPVLGRAVSVAVRSGPPAVTH